MYVERGSGPKVRASCLFLTLLLFTAPNLYLPDILYEQPEINLYAEKGNLYEALFTEPFEVMVFFCNDGTIFTFSNHLADRIYCPIDTIVEWLKGEGLDMGDVVIVVHNHFNTPTFSPADIQFYNQLVGHGFDGVFAIYITSQKKTRIWGEK